jgi:rubrerythrin
MVKLWRCIVCGDPYIGSNPPDNCPFCGAHRQYIVEAKEAQVSFDVELNETDRANAQRALDVEVSNSTFYFCAAKKTGDDEGKILFKALGKVEKEHASIWKKVLKLDSIPEGSETCSEDNRENLQESHDRETRAIEFYRKAADESGSERLKELFTALVEIETDHLDMSEERLG